MPRLPSSEPPGEGLGEAAAIATAVCWSITPFFFAGAARRIGSFPLNVIRLVIAAVLLAAAVLVTGSFHALPLRQVGLLAASGLVGLALGDAALFEAYLALGPRRVSLISATLAPVIVWLLALPLLGETLVLGKLAGMALTLGGVAWVVAEPADDTGAQGAPVRGVVFAVLAAAGQAAGVLLAKAGLGTALAGSPLGHIAAAAGDPPVSTSPLFGTAIRMSAGVLSVVAWAAFAGRFRGVAASLSDRRALALASGGAVFGPFGGVWLSLVAVKYTQAAVAQTIMAFSPALVIVIARYLHRERPSGRAWVGTIVAIGGIVLLTLAT